MTNSRCLRRGVIGSIFSLAGEDREENPGVRSHQRERRYIQSKKADNRLFNVHRGVTQGEHCRAGGDEVVVYFAAHHRANFKRVLHQPVRLDRLDQLHLQI